MLNKDSISAVDASWLSPGNHVPLYGSYCFSEVPDFVRKYFAGSLDASTLPLSVIGDLKRDAKNVVMLFIDAFGWRFLNQFRERYPFVARLCEKGVVSKLSSQFPSTTSAHVTTIHTGMPVHQSGVYEWFCYEPTVGAVIAPLLFSYARQTDPRENLKAAGFTGEQLFPFRSLYQDLQEQGVKSAVFQDGRYSHSSFSLVAFNGATIFPYRSLQNGLDQLVENIQNASGRNYFFLYTDYIDSAAHQFGPDSKQVRDSARNVFESLEKILMPALRSRDDTLLMIIADHGQEAVSPQRMTYLDKVIPDFAQFVRSDPKSGQPLIPAGSTRDMFLYLKEGMRDQAEAALREKISSKADIWRVEDLIAKKIFGPAPSQRLLERLGELVLLPHPGEQVWWSEGGRFDGHFLGNHGGLSPNEAEVVFAVFDPVL